MLLYDLRSCWLYKLLGLVIANSQVYVKFMAFPHHNNLALHNYTALETFQLITKLNL